MKTKITFFSLLLGFKMIAQTITYANFSPSLTSTLNVVVANTSSFNLALLTTTGTAVTWNASGLTQQSGIPTIHFIYGSPSATPNGSLFPTSNYVQYDPALTSVLSYEYYKYSADSVVKVGNYEANSAHEIYQNYDKHLIFPFSYGQSFVDTYAKINYSNATTISSNQTGSRTVIFNGFGTLILPQGTFNNVALVSEERTNSLGPNSHTYTWYDINNGKRLMFYEENAGNINAAYNIDLATGLKELSTDYSLVVFPNPFSGSTTLQLNSTSFLHSELYITNLLGKQVKVLPVNEQEITINKDGLESGVYFYSLKNENGNILNGKFIIE